MASTTKPAARRRRLPAWLRVITWIAGGLVAAALLIAGGVAFTVARTANGLPTFDAMKSVPTGRTIRVHAADGAIIQTSGPAYGEWVPYDRIPQTMRDAIISIEDRRYLDHHGVDVRALARVAWLAWGNRGTGRRQQGASTLTQQAARTIFLDRSYDYRRKLNEMVIALAMETRLDKRQIVELYLNRVYLGGGAYGFDAASRRFFGHPGTELTIQEAALLAGLAKAPTDYAPTGDPARAEARMRTVLRVMADVGTAPRGAQALPAPAITPERRPQLGGNGYFLDWVKPQIEDLARDVHGVVDVWTTLDTTRQAEAEEAVARNAPRGAEGALVSLGPDGGVAAMVGGLTYTGGGYNRAVQATRQPGSSFKAFVYAAALESGRTPGDVLVDEPIEIAGWQPRNSTGRYSGAMTLRTAFAQSVNTIAVKLGQEVTPGVVAGVARRMGISTPINADPSLALGTAGAHVIDMTRAYATIASGGLSVSPYGISRITAGGREIYRRRDEPTQVLPPAVARDLDGMMRAVVTEGTGGGAGIGRLTAGKTGTTSANKDGWFVGYSSGVTTGVWYGRDDARAIDGLQGGRAPARAFAAYMRKAVADLPRAPADYAVTIPGWGRADTDEEPVATSVAATTTDPDAEEDALDEGGSVVAVPPRYLPPPEPVRVPARRETQVREYRSDAPARSRAVPMDQ